MSGSATDQYNLIWRNHQSDLLSSLKSTLFNQNLVDCTLVAEDGRCIKAHRLILSACSPYFERILSASINFQDKNPFFIMKDVNFEDLQALLDYIYKGEALIPSIRIKSFMKVAESFKVKGLVREQYNVKAEGELINVDDCDEMSEVFEEQLQPRRPVRNSRQATESSRTYGDDLESSSNDARITRGNSISPRSASRNDKNPNTLDEIQHSPNLFLEETLGLMNSNLTGIEEKSKGSENVTCSGQNSLHSNKGRITKRPKIPVEKIRKAKKTKKITPSRLGCSNCQKSYKTVSNLIRHETYECGKAPTFKCDPCSKKFKRKDLLKLHFETMAHKAEVAKHNINKS